MLKFIREALLFLLPIIALGLFTIINYQKSGGDLSRLGRISVDKDYQEKILFTAREDSTASRYHQWLDYLNLPGRDSIDVLTLGDSFSDQEEGGFQQYLGCRRDRYVVNLDLQNFAYGGDPRNALTNLHALLNGDFFDSIGVNYVLVESVERWFPSRGINSRDNATEDTLSYRSLSQSSSFTEYGENRVTDKTEIADIVKFPLYSLLYELDDNAYGRQVYRTDTDGKMWSGYNRLLFYDDDLESFGETTDPALVTLINDELNRLASRLSKYGVALIVLPAPNKYTVYYPYIVADKTYPAPGFFKLLREHRKNYLYVPADSVLSDLVERGVRDVYFADDTHWSPVGARAIGAAVCSLMN